MAYSITCSTKILTSAIAPFLLAGVLCEFAMVPGVYILVSLKEDEMHFSSWRRRCTTHSSKRIEPWFVIILLCQKVIAELKKTNNCVMVLIIRPGSTLKFQIDFGFNKYPY